MENIKITRYVMVVREIIKDRNEQSCIDAASSDNISNTNNNITYNTKTDRIKFNPQNQFFSLLSLKQQQQHTYKKVEVCLFVCWCFSIYIIMFRHHYQFHSFLKPSVFIRILHISL